MSILDITVKGLDRVKKQLKVAAGYVKSVRADRVIGKHTKEQVKALGNKPYVPLWPGQKYQRTGALGKGFGSRKMSRLNYAVFNREPHAPFVIKAGMQSGPIGSYPGHRGRWWTMDSVLEQSLPKLTEKLADDIEFLLEAQTD